MRAAHRPTAQTQTVPSDGGASERRGHRRYTRQKVHRRYTEANCISTTAQLQLYRAEYRVGSTYNTLESGMYKEKIIK